MKKTVLLSAFIAVSAISLSKETVVAPIKVVEPTAPVVKPANINLEAIGKMLTVAKASTNKPVETAPALKSMPGFSLGAPAGLTGSFGSVFAGVSGTAKRVNKKNTIDGGMSVGMGWGNSKESLGGAVSVGLGSINPTDGGAFNRGSLALSAGHTFSDLGLGIAAGVNNIDLWHAKHSDIMNPTLYVAATKIFDTKMPVIASVGMGNNSFVNNYVTGDKKTKVDGFGSVGVYVHPQVSVIADYTAGVTSLGLGLVPFKTLPVSFTLAATDVAKQGADKVTSFTGAMSVSMSF